MVFSTTNLFKGIECPQGGRCQLTSCIFGHGLHPQAEEHNSPPVRSALKPSPVQTNAKRSASPSAQPGESTLKRTKPSYGSLADKPLSRAEKIKADIDKVRSGKSTSNGSVSSSIARPMTTKTTSSNQPASLLKVLSPPPYSNGNQITSQPPSGLKRAKSSLNSAPAAKRVASEKQESLNPRLITNAPESHARRTVFLGLIHKDMVRLNGEVRSSTIEINGWEPKRLKLLVLDDQELVKLSLDEEEKVAKEQPKIYGNVIKNRIAAYRKMTLEMWTETVIKSFGKDIPQAVENKLKAIETGLSPEQEALIAQQLVVPDQSFLRAHGYIPIPPTPAEIEEAAKAVEASRNYEECDRCSARFQVFPDRNEDGKLTTNGPCRFHPQKKVFPTKQKTDAYTGGKEAFHPCCMGQVGSVGCTELEDHVWKTGNAARLGVVLPFAITPENPGPAKDRRGRPVKAMCFDCEMGYTALGFELIRLTAVSWPEGEELLDVLVRPYGTIIDLNSRFSGVFPEHFTNAVPYEVWRVSPPPPPPTSQKPGDLPSLPIVESPQKARELLCSFLTPSTPLMGHAIENDLNTTRLCHPSIIDTMLLYPHPRGLPFRLGLKSLSKQYLKRDIQTGGERGHDSLEDAIATGDLVRVKIGHKWKELKAQGWKFEDDEAGVTKLIAPEGIEMPGESLAQGMMAKAFNTAPKGPKKKWKKTLPTLDGTEDSDGGEQAEALVGVDEELGHDDNGQLSVDYLEK